MELKREAVLPSERQTRIVYNGDTLGCLNEYDDAVEQDVPGTITLCVLLVLGTPILFTIVMYVRHLVS